MKTKCGFRHYRKLGFRYWTIVTGFKWCGLVPPVSGRNTTL